MSKYGLCDVPSSDSLLSQSLLVDELQLAPSRQRLGARGLQVTATTTFAEYSGSVLSGPLKLMARGASLEHEKSINLMGGISSTEFKYCN